jgi:hypothetical protein
MEKSKLLQVIAAIMITSMAVSMLSFSTTTVRATLPTATVLPSSSRANTRIVFTVTVTNNYASDNIDNVRIVATSAFVQPIGYAENLVLAADNMENAVAYITQAGDNMILAEDNKKSSGPNIKAVGDNLALVSDGMLAAENGSSSASARLGVYANLTNVQSYLQLVADAIDNSVENLEYIWSKLDNAGAYLRLAAGKPAKVPTENMENVTNVAAKYLDNAGADIQSAATAIRKGDLETAGQYLKDAGDNIVATGDNVTQVGLKAAFQNAGSQLQTAGNKLLDAGNFLDNAGYALGVAENYLTSAGVRLATVTNLATAGANLQIAALFLENAGVAMCDNLPSAGENLKLASDNLENMSAELGVDLGKDGENAAAVNIDYAAENLKNKEKTDITTAGNQLKSAATNLSAGAVLMKSTASSLTPITWTLTSGTGYVQLDAIDNQLAAIGDNIIAPAGSQTFTFLWTTPNIATQTDYLLSVLASKEEATYTSYDNLGGFTLSVDGKVPSVSINVTQTGVTPAGTVNVVGTKLDNARATITIVSANNEPLSSIGTVYVENSGQNENLLPPILATSFTTTDNITWVYQYITVDNWDDNSVAVRLSSAKDSAGNENTADMENIITVDTRAPVFTDNGLVALVASMRTNVTQAGTGTMFRYVDNNASHNMTMVVSDNNPDDTDNDIWVTSVVIGSTAATRDPTLENRWTATTALSTGYNSTVVVMATDRTGNTASDNIDNIFIDTQPTTITFNTITRTSGAVVWIENAFLTNDNTPQINVTILDPGYPTSGLGVAFRGLANPDNLYVYLDNNDNINDGTPAAPYGPLDNKSPWSVSTGVFENVIDNAGHGLANGTYWIIVAANDNLAHGVLDNDNWAIAKQSFTVDVSAPIWTTTLLQAAVTVKDSVTSAVLGTPTKKTSWLIAGGAQKPGSTINVYVSASAPVLKGTTTASTTINNNTNLYDYSLTIVLLEGAGQSVSIEEVDTASNTSGLVLLGTYTVDATPPVIALSAPAIDTTTDAAQITVSGTITDAIVTDPQTLGVTIDCTGASVAKTVYLDANGYFETTVPLVEGVNKINVVAVDGAVTATSGNQAVTTRTVTRTVTPLTTYAIILVVVALILAAIAIFRKEMKK